MNINNSTLTNFISRLNPAVLAGAFLATALVAGPSRVDAYPEIDEPVTDTAELEATFWTCDYAATVHGVDRDTAVLCQTAMDELKKKRFGGSFERLLEWWSANKAEQYAALDRGWAEVVRGSETEMDFPESI